MEALAHAGGQVAILRVGGCFFEGAELVLALVVFFFATVAAVWSFGAIAALVSTTMSRKETLVLDLKKRCCDCEGAMQIERLCK